MEAWYSLYTKPNAEAQVARALEVRGFQFFLPLLPPATAQGRPQALFPSYLFVRCDLSEVGIERLEFLPGLRRIVSFAGKPAVVSDAAVAMMEGELADIEAAGGILKHSFQLGDRVVIDSGPLAGLRGVFQGPMGPSQRVRILVRFLGETNRAEVPLDTIRKAGDDDLPHRRRGTRGRGRRIRYER